MVNRALKIIAAVHTVTGGRHIRRRDCNRAAQLSISCALIHHHDEVTSDHFAVTISVIFAIPGTGNVQFGTWNLRNGVLCMRVFRWAARAVKGQRNIIKAGIFTGSFQHNFGSINTCGKIALYCVMDPLRISGIRAIFLADYIAHLIIQIQMDGCDFTVLHISPGT